MPFRPLRDQILVKPVPWRQSRTLEVVSNDRYSRAIVIAVGPGEPLRRPSVKRNGKTIIGNLTGRIREMEVAPGDYIVYGFDQIFPRYIEDGIEYRVLQDKDVCFISDADSIDAHSNLTDFEIETLIALHGRSKPALEIGMSKDFQDAVVKGCVKEMMAGFEKGLENSPQKINNLPG